MVIQPPLLCDWIFEWTLFCCYIVIINFEEGWLQQNSSVTCRPRQSHYFNCPCTPPSGGGASRVHGLTTSWLSVSSWIRRQLRRSLALYPSTNIHSSTTRRASRLNILLFIQFIFYIFYYAFWWSVRTYGIHFLFDIIFRSLDYSYLYYVYIVILSYSILYFLFNTLF